MKTYNNPFPKFKGKHGLTVFDTPGQFMSYLDTNASQADKDAVNSDPSFYNGDDWADITRKAVTGDKALAKRAESIMNKIVAKSPATSKRVRKASPHGRVSIGAYLSADPMPCRVMVKEKTASAPLSVVVSLDSLADVDSALLERRGVAIASLVKRLVKDRPVTLYLSRFSITDGNPTATAMLVKFPTTPLDSYRLAYLLSGGFGRGAGFAYHNSVHKLHGGKDVGGSYRIYFAGGRGYSQTRHCDFADDLTSHLRHEVFYIPGTSRGDVDFATMDSSIKWVNDTCDALTKVS